MKKRSLPLSLTFILFISSQIWAQVPNQKFQFEVLSVTWKGSQLEFYDLSQKLLIKLDLTETQKKQSLSEKLGEKVEEEDLGGSLKNQAPLASKNLKLRSVNENRLKEKPNPSGKAVQLSQKNKEGGIETVYGFSDGSKKILFAQPNLKKESFFNKKGALVYESSENTEAGLKIKKVTWDEGSKTYDYENSQGSLLVLYDQETKRWNFTVLNSQKTVLTEIGCEKQSCELYGK